MGERIDIEWAISEPDEHGLVMVRAHLVGAEKDKFWGPMPAAVGPTFLRAKRDALSRSMRTRAHAIQIFTAPPTSENLQ